MSSPYAPPEPVEPSAAARSRWQWLLALPVVLAGSCMLLYGLSIFTHLSEQHGIGRPASEAFLTLPGDASNVSFYSRPPWPFQCCEFDTSETSFHAWVAGASHVTFDPPVEGSVNVPAFDYLAKQSRGEITLGDGILYKWREADRGDYRAYDRAHGRAYYFSHSR